MILAAEQSASAKAGAEAQRLLVVSNRLPVTLRATGGWRSERSSGGLATAMNPMLKRFGGLWIGWPGESDHIGDPARQAIVDRWETKHGLISVELPPDIAQHFYEGYSNQTLWPLFHYFPSRLAFDPKGWDSYRRANELFRDRVVAQYREGDLIWIHDYQLMLLPRLLREALPHAAIGFFLHIPFPSAEVFRILPERETLLAGLLGADLVAFQTYSHLQHFRGALRRVLGTESMLDEVVAGGRTVVLDALPIGIAPGEFAKTLASKEAQARLRDFEQRYRNRKLILAVDRMDYTKGIPERLRTFRRLLHENPDLHSKVVLLQIAVPSREQVDAYDRLRRQVNELVGEINGQFATPDWTPVVYIRRGISKSELAALYATADVAWIGPLRDGMNLVAKEFVACNQKQNGVLLLSEFAGAAEEMGETLLINPNDEARTAAEVRRALNMPPEERARRMTALQFRIQRNDVFAWAEQFLQTLRSAARAHRDESTWPKPLNTADLLADFQHAARRAIVFDYDGTLIGFANKPSDAIPTPELLKLLHNLAADPNNRIMIISGRRRTDIQQWFGSLDRVWLAAEHGAFLRRPGEPWQLTHEDDTEALLKRVRPILDHFVARTPGSFVEEKERSLAWHYRMSETRFADWLAQELVAMLEDMLAETDLRAVRGRKIVEVRPSWLHKGNIAKIFLEHTGPVQFQLAAGDDRTDENLFAAFPPTAWTIHVGPERSAARFSVRSPQDMIVLMESMASFSVAK
jgi:trehalose 6-phosphate synthase/phosphatase